MKQTSELKWVTAARVVGDYCLELTFNDGYCCVFDCASLISIIFATVDNRILRTSPY